MTEPKKPPPFTADNLPEAARAFFDDEKGAGERAARKIVRDLDDHAAKVINSLCAARPGLREWLLNGTAPVATHEPPEVDNRLLSEAHRLIGDMSLQGDALKRGLEGFLQIVWQTRRPAADPVRFALEKVSYGEWEGMIRDAAYVDQRPNGLNFVAFSEVKLIDNLAKILPVAKSWAELTDAEGAMIIRNACKAAAITGTEAEAVASLRASLSAYAPPPRAVEVTPEVMEVFTEAWCALNEQNGQTFTNEPGYENLSRPIMTAHLYSFRAALAVANTQANARESEVVAEVERWREMSIANRDAFAAMRNAINEHIPIQSDEADLLAGPEFSVSCEAVARAVIAEVARLRDLVEQCERKIARKDAVLAHPEIQALLNKIGFGVEPGETEVERLRSLIGDDNIAALAEGRARIVPANQAPGMPHAACHACRIGDYCESADCPNARLEIERLEGDLTQAEAQLDHANVEIGLIVSERDALKSDVERLTKERDEAIAGQDDYGARWKEAETRELRLTEELTVARAHTAELQTLLTVHGVDRQKVRLWLPFEQRCSSGWKDAEFTVCFQPRDGSAHWSFAGLSGAELRQTPAPGPELKRWRVKLAVTDQHDNAGWTVITTDSMTRGLAEKIGEVIGEAE
jgi:hypothetical protein